MGSFGNFLMLQGLIPDEPRMPSTTGHDRARRMLNCGICVGNDTATKHDRGTMEKRGARIRLRDASAIAKVLADK